jgi:hypothetical protein
MRLVELSWKLLEYKLMYYTPEKIDPKWHKKLTISDQEYDSLEMEYKALGGKSHVDFPYNLPCGHLVLDKYRPGRE